MSKVLVDLAALEEAAKWLEVHSSNSGSAEALREAIAQPAEAEGVKRWALDVDCLYPSEEGGWCEYGDHLAALSAVTAENERLVRDAKNDAVAYRAVIERQEELRAEVERWKGYTRNWESVAHKQDRRLKDILRGLASDKALSVFQAPCDIELLPVPCEVIHDDDVLLVIRQRDAAVAAKEG